jgi:hypothetical protein
VARFCAAGAGGVKTFKHASAPPRSYGQRLELVEGTSPRGLPYHFSDISGNIKSAPLLFCRVVLLLLRQRRGASGPHPAGFARRPKTRCGPLATLRGQTCCGIFRAMARIPPARPATQHSTTRYLLCFNLNQILPLSDWILLNEFFE